jgi:hypothetical protein
MMKHRLRAPLKQFGSKINSQNDEDGIISAIFNDIPPRAKFFVEFGIGPNWLDKTYANGLEGNCVLLRHQGWGGVFMDGGVHPVECRIEKEFITALNINTLLRKYNTPEDVDIVSIDVDGQDFWIWMALDFRPTLLIIEMNPNFLSLNDSITVAWDPNFRWDVTKYYGASLGALVKLGYEKGYKLVYANGTNAFFIRSDMLSNPEDFPDESFVVFADQFNWDHMRRYWVSI